MMDAALGIREHSGWGMLVVVVEQAAGLEVILRRKVALLADGLPREPFHAAARMSLDDAQRLVDAAYESARDCAAAALAEAREELTARDIAVRALGCGVGATPVRAPFAKVMTSHALLHASEGEMYRDAVAEAASAVGLAVARAPWKEMWAQAGAELGIAPDALRDRIAALRAVIGPPWGSDEKEACVAGWLALSRSATATR